MEYMTLESEEEEKQSNPFLNESSLRDDADDSRGGSQVK